jgi:hypothetical protein
MNNDNGMSNELITLACILAVSIFLFFQIHSCPILDNKNNPFIVRQVKERYFNPQGTAKYYGRIQKDASFRPKPLILEKGRYNIGDTIFFYKR